MEKGSTLGGFFDHISQDNRIGSTHISLYVALYVLWERNGYINPVEVSRQEVMAFAKISSRTTYVKCLYDLTELGFIKYLPSYNPFLNSMVYIN